jgi:hypothetical protein
MADAIDRKVEEIIKRLSESRDIVQYFQDIARLTSLTSEDAKALQTALKNVAASSKEVLGNFQDVSRGLKSTTEAQKEFVKSQKAQQKLTIEINKQLSNQGFTQDQIREILAKSQVERERYLYTTSAALDYDIATVVALADAYDLQKENTDQARENLKIAQNYNKSLGLAGGIVGGIGEGLKKLGFDFGVVNDALTESKDAMIDLADELTDGGSMAATLGQKFKIAGQGAATLGKNLVKGLADPVFLGEQLVSALVAVDDQAGKIAKNFGISYDQALGLTSELTQAANTSYLLNVSTAGLADAFVDINNRYGTFAQISQENLKTFQQLKDTVGLTAETLGALSDISIVTGQNTEDVTKNFLGQAKALALQNNLALNEREILESISQVSKATLLSIGAQPNALAKAIVQAKALGLTLEEVASISNSLLQFEDSITSELEAELLVGKDLTLEKARQAALNNDLATVSEEIAKQVGTAADFAAMNVLQQEALAKAVGLSREDLAKSLMEREALAKLGAVEGNLQEEYNKLVAQGLSQDEIANKLGNESLANMLQTQTVQERFNAAITKLQDLFVGLAEPILKIVSPLVDLVTNVLPAINFLLSPLIAGFDLIGQGIGYLVQGLRDSIPLTIALAGVTAILARRALATAISNIFASSALGGPVGLALGGIAVAGLLSMLAASATSIKDGMISPDGGLIVSGPKGTYSLDRGDTVVAGTGIGQSAAAARQTGLSGDAVMQELKNMTGLLSKINQKEGTVRIGTTAAGTAFAVGTSKLQ